jgi:hypothetical protein
MARHERMAWASLAGCALALAAPSAASAQAAEIRVAVYAPWSGPSTADERFAFGTKLAEAVGAAGLGTAKVSSFARLVDFRRALGNTRFDIALVDAGATSVLGARLKVTASWSSGEPWVLASGSPAAGPRGRRLALQAADAPSSRQLVQRLLRHQVSGTYWRSVVGAPVTSDALQLVARGGADVVIAPRRAAADLTEVVNLGSFSELAIATRTSSMDAAAAEIQRALRALRGGEWRAGAPRFPEAVALTRLQTIPPEVRSMSFLNLLSRPASAPPGLAVDDMWIEPDAP